jgi:F0F1-type ATP synthase membrane subunit b/b'
MMIRMSDEPKEKLQDSRMCKTKFKDLQENTGKKLKKTQKQINELREDFNKLQNETKENTKKEI